MKSTHMVDRATHRVECSQGVRTLDQYVVYDIQTAHSTLVWVSLLLYLQKPEAKKVFHMENKRHIELTLEATLLCNTPRDTERCCLQRDSKLATRNATTRLLKIAKHAGTMPTTRKHAQG